MNGRAMTAQRECHWEIDGLRYSGLEWGPEDGQPVLALHGWMDHADSFQELAPRLTGYRVVALDLSGQGLSGHRAPHATYNIWDDLPQIAGILDQLGWQDCVVIGHSRGANIGTLLSAALPERVRALVALDSLVPAPQPEENVVATLRAFITETREQMTRPPRTFPSREDYIDRRQKQGNSPLTSAALATRALDESSEGVRMRGDRRLFASSAVKFTQGQITTILRAVQCPVLNIWAGRGISKDPKRGFDMRRLGPALIADYTAIEIEGDHHFHLDPPAAGLIADAVLDFLAQHG